MTLLQQSFVSTLETDLALRADRGDEIVRIVLETLLRLRPELRSGDIVMAIGNGLQNYMASRKLDVGYLGGDSGNVEQWHDVSSASDSFWRLTDMRTNSHWRSCIRH